MHGTPSTKSIVITGSSTGIGAACAVELARRGWHVFAGVRKLEHADSLLESLGTGAGSIHPLLVDVTDGQAVQAAAREVAAAVGGAGLGALVNNAGIVIAGPLEILPIEQFRRQLEVNLVGALAVTQQFIPLLRKSRGRLVNISSVNGAIAPPYLGAYAASKHALEAIGDSLRLELRPWGIGVAMVEPGPTQTPIWEKSSEAGDDLAARVPAESLALYEGDFAAMRKAAEGLAARAVSVHRVVHAVLRALTDRRPRSRYYITWESRLSYKGFRMLPDRFRDWIVRRALGLR
ncbi:MAG: SDR family NAD(P)-dependent oxidoreductase [Thermoguttaceae bacterium]|nr:SDR family NAD(P)-dependent oxidoreductase [Thermoguttaceae bacterium]